MRERGWRVRMVIPPWGMASTEDRNGWSCRRWQWAGDKCPAVPDLPRLVTKSHGRVPG